MDQNIRNLSLLGGKLDILLEYLRMTSGVFGNVAELGVYKGGAARLMLNEAGPLKTLVLFDTFSGMPSQGPHDIHKVGDFADTSLQAVKALFGREDKVEFFVGDFEKIKLPDYAYSFVHLDADQYEVTKAGLEYFYPRVTREGYLVLDDYEWANCPGVKKAVEEFFADKPEKPLIRGCQAIVRKL
jgi:O-methyltransferase